MRKSIDEDSFRPSSLRKLYFHFLSHRMGYDRGDSFPIDFEPNEIQFGSKSKGNFERNGIHLVQNRKENCPHDHIPFNVKGNGKIVFSVYSHESVYSQKQQRSDV